MKKHRWLYIGIILNALITFDIDIYAQHKTTMGLNIIGARSKIYGDQMLAMLTNSPKNSISTGISFQSDLTRFIGYSIGLNYLNLGCGFEDADGDLINDDLNKKIDVIASLKYIQLPLSIDILFFKDRRLYVFTGAYISKLLKGTIVGSINDYSAFLDDTDLNENITDEFTSIDYGFIFGMGSQIRLHKKIMVGIDMHYDLGNQIVNKNNAEIPDYKLKNRALVLDIGLLYEIK